MTPYATHAVLFSFAFLCAVPFVARGEEMASEEYRVYGHGVGGVEGQVLASEQYTLTPILGGEYIHGDGDESLPPRHGSRSRTVTTTPEVDVTDIIGGVLKTPRGGIAFTQHTYRAGNQEDREVISTSKYDESDVIVPVNTIPEKSVENAQSASVLGATREYVGNVKALLSDTFQERSARLAFFLFVVITLYLVRTYTEVGKKHRPF